MTSSKLYKFKILLRLPHHQAVCMKPTCPELAHSSQPEKAIQLATPPTSFVYID